MMALDVSKLLGREGRSLYPFERAALSEVAAGLGEAGHRLRQQMEAVNKVQRLVSGKEVNLYRIRGGKPDFDDALRFAGGEDEALLATVWLKRPDEGRRALKLEMWLANGRLFSLIYDKPPDAFFAGSRLSAAQAAIDDMRIWLNPAERPSPGAEAVVPLAGWARSWVEQGLLTRLQAPLPQAVRERALEGVDAALPADYLELAAQMNGAEFRSCAVHGLGNIRKIVSPEANYYVLAECSGSALAVREGSRDGALVALLYEDDRVETVGAVFKEAVELLADRNQAC
jgi:hypothetical protein